MHDSHSCISSYTHVKIRNIEKKFLYATLNVMYCPAEISSVNVYCPECPPGGYNWTPGWTAQKVFAVRSWKGPSCI